MRNPFERPVFGKKKAENPPTKPESGDVRLEGLQDRLRDLREQREMFGVHPADAPLEQQLIDKIRSQGGKPE